MASKAQIKAEQRKLKAMKFYHGDIDGVDGGGTKAARALLKSHNAQKARERTDRRQANKDALELARLKAATKQAEAKAKEAKAKASSDKSKADAEVAKNDPWSKGVGLVGQGAAVGAGAYVGHKFAQSIRTYMNKSQKSANNELKKLGAKAAPLVKKGIKTSTSARLGQSISGQFKNIRRPMPLRSGLAISAFLAGDAALAHFWGRDKAREAGGGGDGAVMAVDTFTSTTALAATSNLAFTFREAANPTVQWNTTAAADIKAVGAMSDDFLKKVDVKKVVKPKPQKKLKQPRNPNRKGTRDLEKTKGARLRYEKELRGDEAKISKTKIVLADGRVIKPKIKGGNILKGDVIRAHEMMMRGIKPKKARGRPVGSKVSTSMKTSADMVSKAVKKAPKASGLKKVAMRAGGRRTKALLMFGAIAMSALGLSSKPSVAKKKSKLKKVNRRTVRNRDIGRKSISRKRYYMRKVNGKMYRVKNPHFRN